MRPRTSGRVSPLRAVRRRLVRCLANAGVGSTPLILDAATRPCRPVFPWSSFVTTAATYAELTAHLPPPRSPGRSARVAPVHVPFGPRTYAASGRGARPLISVSRLARDRPSLGLPCSRPTTPCPPFVFGELQTPMSIVCSPTSSSGCRTVLHTYLRVPGGTSNALDVGVPPALVELAVMTFFGAIA